MLRAFTILFILSLTASICSAQTDSTYVPPKFDAYQIYLKKPVKEIKEILYHKDCQPIKGKISEGQKSIIMENYEPGNRVYMQLIYLDGTEEELVRAPCYIDPVIL